MASITFAFKFKSRLEKFPWVNWSEVAREDLIKEEQLKSELERIKKIVSKSKFTQKDADEISALIKKSRRDELKKQGLI